MSSNSQRLVRLPASGPAPRRLPLSLRRLNPLALAALCLVGRAHALDPSALPSHGSVGAGQGKIVLVENGLRIDQTTDRMTVNWGSFNIGSARSVTFAQPSRSSVVLNRVATSGGSTEIAGRLSANGNVFLLNANGILFSSTARVDVGGLVASTLSLSDKQFMARDYSLRPASLPPPPPDDDYVISATVSAAGANTDVLPTAAVVNQGALNAASGGSIALVAPRVANTGTIVAQRGTVALASGNAVTLDFNGDQLIKVAVNEGALKAAAVNGGLIQADGGLVLMTAGTASDLVSAVNNSGEIRASRVEKVDGVVRLIANGPVKVDGTVQASGLIDIDARLFDGTGALGVSGDRGGEIRVRAHTVDWSGKLRADGGDGPGGAGGAVSIRSTGDMSLGRDSVLTVSGNGGDGGNIALTSTGGSLSLAGGVRADGLRGGTIQVTAPSVTLSGAALSASGRDQGGTIHVGGGWQGAGPLAHAGQVYVDGPSEVRADATQTGHGGEVVFWSSDGTRFHGQATARGGIAAGDGGRIEISSNGTLDVGGTLGAAARSISGNPGQLLLDHRDIHVAQQNTDDCCAVASDAGSIDPWVISSAVQNGTAVHLQASNDIVVNAPIQVVEQTGNAALTLQAGRSIRVNADIDTGRSDLTLTANDSAALIGDRGRDSGAASIEMLRHGDYATRIDAGAGAVDIRLLNGAGAADAIRLSDVSAASVFVRSQGTPEGFDLELNGVLSATGGGNALVVGGRRLKVGGAAQPFNAPNGRWLAYSEAPDTNSLGSAVSPGNLFGRSLADDPPDSIAQSFGNRFVYEISPTLNVAADPVSRAYGDANPNLGFKESGLVAGDTAASALSGALSSTANVASHAGTYAIEQGTLAERLGYELVFSGAPLTVTPRQITLAVDDQARAYGHGNPKTGTAHPVAGSFAFGDTASSIGVQSSLAATAHAGDAASLRGSGVVLSGGSNGNVPSDYAVTYQDGVLRVTPAPVTLRVDDQTRRYGDANPGTGSVSLVAGGLHFGDAAGQIGVSSGLAATAHAGTSAALNGSAWAPTGGSNASRPGDYAVSLQSGTLAVTPRPITLKVNDQSRSYGDANPDAGSVSLMTGSLPFGDVAGHIGVSSDLAATAHAGTSTALNGSAWAPTGGSNASRPGDYAVSLQSGTLAVTPRPITLKVNDQSRSYGDANPDAGSASLVAGSLQFGDVTGQIGVRSDLAATAHAGTSAALNGSAWAPTGGSNASRPGDYAVSLQSGTLAVTPRPITLKVNDQSRSYGDANPDAGSVSLVTGSLQFGDVAGHIGVTTDLAATAHAGTSAALNGSAWAPTGGSNASRPSDYAVSLQSGTLAVAPRPITLKVNDQSRSYGDANPDAGSVSLVTGSLPFGDVAGHIGVSSDLAATAHAGTSAALNGSAWAPTGGSNASRPSDYAVSLQSGTLAVAPRPITLKVNDQSRSYGDANPDAGSVSLVTGSLPFGDVAGHIGVSSDLAATAHAGTSAALNGSAWSPTGGSNASRPSDYAVSLQSGTLAVAPRPITLKVNDQSRSYGDANPDAGSVSLVTGSLPFGDVAGHIGVSSDLAATAHAGTSAALNGSAWAPTGGSNASRRGDYAVSLQSGTLAVTPRPITLKVNDQSRSYGDANPDAGSVSLMTGSLPFGDVAGHIGVSSDLAATAHAGTSAALSGSAWAPTGGSNASRRGDYAVSLQSGTLAVTPRPITLKVNDQSRSYGDANPDAGSVSLVAGSLPFGDVAGHIGITTDLAATAHAGTSAALDGSSWAPTGGSNASRPGDYAVSLQSGTLAVTPRPITLKVNDQSRSYGDANPDAGSVSLVTGSLPFGDVAGHIGVTTDLAATAHAGTSAALNGSAWAPTGGSNASRPSDYAVSLQSGTLAVTPRPITLKVNDQSRSYGDANPDAGSVSLVTGSLPFGDVAGHIGVSSDLAATAHAGTSAALSGSAWAPTGGSNASRPSDYAVSLQSGTLAVAPRPITLKVNDQSRSYGDANPDAGSVSLVTGSLPFGDVAGHIGVTTDLAATAHAGTSAALNGSAWAPTGGSNASRRGDYAVSLQSGTLAVTPRPITLKVNDQSRSYGDANPSSGAATVTQGSLVFGDAVGAVALATDLPATAHAGSSAELRGSGHAPTGGSNASAASDYAVRYEPGKLDVTQRPITLSLDDQTRPYGDANPTQGRATVNAGTLAFGDTLASVKVESPLAATAHAGDSAVLNGTGVTLNSSGSRVSDYAITYDNANLTVTPRPVTLTIDDQGRDFGAANATRGTATPSDGSLVFGDSVTGVAVHSALPSGAALGTSGPLAGVAAEVGGGSNGSRSGDYAFAYRAGRLTVASLPESVPDSGTLVRIGEVSPVAVTPAPSSTHTPTQLVVLAQPQQGSLAYQPEQFLASVNERHDRFTDLFKTALQVLQNDPDAADLPPCPENTEDRRGADEELCMPSEARRILAGKGEVNPPSTSAGLPPEEAGETAKPPEPPADSPPPAPPEIRRKQAFLIGIEDYEGDIPHLKTPISDAKAMSRELEERFGYEVTLRQNATKRDIVSMLKQVARETKDDDSVLVYFAGHGYMVDGTRAGYWIPSDASKDDPRSWISNSDVTEFLSLIKARQIILVADSCYSGTFTRGGQLDPAQVSRTRGEILSKRSVMLMTSGGEEPVYDTGGGGHSIFAGSLLESLRNAEHSQIGSTVYAKVKDLVETRFPQSPSYGVSKDARHEPGGEYLFEPKGASVPAPEGSKP